MKNKKYKKIIKWFLIGIGLAFATLITAIIVIFYFFLIGGPAKTTKDIGKYETIFEEQGLRTGYMVFPESIPEGVEDVDFYHSYRDTLFSPTVETFLQCTYDEKTYQKEVDRLENTSKTYGNKKMLLLRDTEQKFYYPAYIAVENAASTYEYALLTGERQITYIFTMYRDSGDVHFDKKYLPKDYDEKAEEEPVFGSGYSIYYSNVSSNVITTDYTRSPVTELNGSHMRMIGDDSFVVYYVVDETGREMITGCSFWKTLDEFDMNETQYHDIDGMEYVDMEVSKNYKNVSVTYLQDGAEKVQIYDVFELQ